jgi:hypothetical protein
MHQGCFAGLDWLVDHNWPVLQTAYCTNEISKYRRRYLEEYTHCLLKSSQIPRRLFLAGLIGSLTQVVWRKQPCLIF